MTTCPHCGELVGEADEFCEACGQTLDAGTVGGAPEPPPGAELGTQRRTPTAADESTASIATPAPRCQCGGEIDADGWCTVCGLRAPSERDHYSEQPAPHVAAVCDRGVRPTVTLPRSQLRPPRAMSYRPHRPLRPT